MLILLLGCTPRATARITPSATTTAAFTASAAGTGAAPARLPMPQAAVARGAAIVWLPDAKAERGFRSVWIEPEASTAKAIAERKDLVLAGTSELWAIASRTVRLSTPKCADPTSDCNAEAELSEPYLQSLATGKRLDLAWDGTLFGPTQSCNKSVDVTFDGFVGTILFARAFSLVSECGSPCSAHDESLFDFDIDTGQAVTLEFPADVIEPQRARARLELNQHPEAPDYCEALPAYRATGAYDARGELEGLYEFGDSHPGACGGTGCPNPVERAARAPAKLAPWAKLPAWVARYLASSKAEHAALISEARFTAAKKEFGP